MGVGVVVGRTGVLLVPLGVVTVTSTVPAVPSSTRGLRSAVSDRTVKSVAATPPKLTASGTGETAARHDHCGTARFHGRCSA